MATTQGNSVRSQRNSIGDSVALIDAHSLFWRAWTTYNKFLINGRGEPCGALLGFHASLNRVFELGARYYIPVFDHSRKTFRHKIYRDYKAGRAPMPEEQVRQLGWIRAGMKVLFNTPPIDCKDYEADDIIAHLSRLHQPCLIVSPDKDLLQLVNERVRVYTPATKEILDAGAVEKKMGVPPNLVADKLALMGDKADGVPGIEGVGAVGAAKLLQRFGSLKKLIAECDSSVVKGADKVRGQRARLERNLDLTRLDRNVPVRVNLENFKTALMARAEWSSFVEQHIT